MTIFEQNLPIDIDRIQSFYKEYVEQHGVSAGWSTQRSAENAYRIAASYADQQWSTYQSVLDVGSGEGHFSTFLRAKCGFVGQYTGLELLPLFYENALKLYAWSNTIV